MTGVAAGHVAADEALTDFAAAVGTTGPVAVVGHRTRWEAGGLPDEGTRLVTAPSGIVAVDPSEMTVRVLAGTPVGELHAAVAEAGQCTGLPERGGTVGGALAVGEDSPLVPAARRLRETLLQVRYVSAEGRVVTGGGPTVKNVSGYDLPRLLVGSLGTLGLLAEVLLRTDPVPAASVWMVAPDADPMQVTDALHLDAPVLWDRRRTWVQLCGHEPDVEHERAVLADHGTFAEADGPPPLPPHRWSVRRSLLFEITEEQTGQAVFDVAVGTVHASEPQPVPPPSPALAALADRVKREFDPGGRLNPGRDPARR